MRTANILEFKLLGTLQPWPETKKMLERGIVSILEITQWYPGAMAGSKEEEGWKGSKETEVRNTVLFDRYQIISYGKGSGYGIGDGTCGFEGVGARTHTFMRVDQ